MNEIVFLPERLKKLSHKIQIVIIIFNKDQYCSAGTQRRNNVGSMSIRLHDVQSMLFRILLR